jgi:ABC-type phosphate transport system substrate-binding protein
VGGPLLAIHHADGRSLSHGRHAAPEVTSIEAIAARSVSVPPSFEARRDKSTSYGARSFEEQDTMTKLSMLAAAIAALATPGLAAANPACSSLPDPIVVAGSSAIGPFVKAMGQILAGQAQPTTLIYQKQGSCTGVNAVVLDTTPTGACASGACIKGTATYYDATGTALTCDLDAAGTHVDVGLSDVWTDTCTGQLPPAGVVDISGPVEPMVFIVPKASMQVAITSEEAYFVFGFGAQGQAMPWVNEMMLFVRNALSGTEQVVAHAIAVPAGRWKGIDKGNADGVIAAVGTSTSPEATIGIVGAADYDPHRDTLTELAFQAYHQKGAYYADSTATSFNKKNVRDGHYTMFGYLHLITHVDGSNNPATPAALRFVDWITGNTARTPAPFDITDVTINAHLIPTCAMKVKRNSEGGALSPYTPPTDCGAHFESLVGQ